ncbi:MAG: Sua5/YciO/YrdC/YwlC family protein [Pseudoxanthomonas suwonensis]|nr:Sua5/YciO/YrdC/YwlC family protein [Pseudoxanthomonas suwonensis]
MDIAQAARQLQAGAVLAWPTEAVWGLGCDPFNAESVTRLLALKQRSVGKGLIVIAASRQQLQPLVDWAPLEADQIHRVLADWPGPHTWVLPAMATAPRWITGAHAGIAVRVSAHPTCVALCEAFGGALVSTSANRGGEAPARDREGLDPAILAGIDGVVDGATGGLAQPTPIRDARSGAALRR